MFSKAVIPYGMYWTSPFVRWQGAFATLHSVRLAAHVAKRELNLRELSPDIFDHAVLGITTPQRATFHGTAWLMTEIGAPEVAGPMIGQACATGARCLTTSAQEVELGTAGVSLALACERVSNSPLLTYPDPSGVNGRPEVEHWMMDNLEGVDLVSYGDIAMTQVAENVARDWHIETEEQHEVALRRYEQYKDAVADDHAFQRRYMTLPFDVPDKSMRKVAGQLDGDEGIFPTRRDKLSKLRPVFEGGTITYAGQTHPADGNAAMIVTTAERARELSRDPAIEIRIRAYGQARCKPKYMPLAPVPAARQALERAALRFDQLTAIKSHNPFAVNDIVFARETGVDLMSMNNYGSSLVWGHPHAATGMRGIIELIEELVIRGGGYGLFQGCAAGDLAMAVVLEVTGS